LATIARLSSQKTGSEVCFFRTNYKVKMTEKDELTKVQAGEVN
jgi:hypothetical protein